MGRFYADLDRLQHDKLPKQSKDDIFASLSGLHRMSSSHTLSPKRPNLVTDRDGDIIMTETISASLPVSPFKEKFSFEWFSFDDSKHSSAKAPLFSPTSPASSTTRKLSVSTASPSSYFSDFSPTIPDFTNKTKANGLVSSRRLRASQVVLPSAPNPPLNWIWQCHLCRSRYPLSVTRRCLIDGHYYCSGVTTTTQRNVKRRKANRSCSSEFDYVGWQDWGRWTRKCKSLKAYAAGKENGPILQGCEGCSFPSQCRYENRPRQETLKFSDYIDDKDIDALMVDEVEELVSPEKQAFEEELLTRPSKLSGLISEKMQKHTNSPQALKEAVVMPKLRTLDTTTNSAAEKLILSKRQRFYSGIANTISIVSTNSARDNSEKGKFDPTLPSVSAPITASGNEADKEESQGYLDIIEATLRSALPTQSPVTQYGTQRSHSLSQISTLPGKAKTRKRLNSKIDDPEFEVLADDARRLTSVKDTASPSKPGPGLTRTTSEQSLITDLFRQVKSNSSTTKDKTLDEKAKRAASEIDIAEFLQLRKPTITSPRIKTPEPISVDPIKALKPPQHFEEIHLTPKESKIGDPLAEILTPSIEMIDGGKSNTDPVKRDPESPNESPGSDGGEKGVATGLAGGLFNFGFGRK